MQKLEIVAAFIWCALLVPMAVCWFIDYRRFVRNLRENHVEHWASLGSPGVLEDEPAYKPYGFFTYFFGRKYSDLGSPETTALGDRVFRWHKWAFVSWLSLAAIALASRVLA